MALSALGAHAPPTRKLYGRLTWIALALTTQLCLLLTLSYNPNALTQVVSKHFWSADGEAHSTSEDEWSSMPELPPENAAQQVANDHPVTASDWREATDGVQPIRRPTRAGRKKIYPTTLRERSWSLPHPDQPTSLCGDEGHLPTAADLASITDHDGKGAIIIPSLNHHDIVSSANGADTQIVLSSERPLCAWLVIVDWGDGVAATPYHNPDPIAERDFPPPISNWPPDSVEIRATGENYTLPIHADRDFLVIRGRPSEVAYRLYNITLDLKDPDSYEIDAVLEYTDYLWNYEVSEHVFWAPSSLPILINRHSLQHLPQLRLTTAPETHPQLTHQSYSALPPCGNGNHRGRWVPAAHLDPTPSLRMHVPRDGEEITDEMPLLLKSYSDRVWVPYSCRYHARTYAVWKDRCIAPRHPFIHMFGDSNIRRGVKAFASGGRWCKDWYEENSPACQCTDWHLDIDGLQPDRPDNVLTVAGGNDEPALDEAYVYTFLWKGLNSWGPDWNMALNASDQRIRIAAINQHLADRPPTVVIVSLTNWDAAYGSYAEFSESLPIFIELLRKTYYDRGIPLVWRAGQYFGGRADTTSTGLQRRKFSRMRVLAFNELAERTLVDELDAAVWDVHALGDANDAPARARAAQCNSGHAGRDVVDVENGILLNLLCNE
ncbi:hypothetical protein DFJ77DRAFT_552191 [Powellomyces hirtus]|nr:hypothetical protein DFJ77DRAFT_552191 [Powellomyces hirtus]